MGCSYRIDLDERRVLSKACGALSADEIQAHMLALSQDPDFRKDMDQLFDVTEVEKAELTGPDVRRIARDSPFGDGSRRAFVVASDVNFGIARMFELLFGDRHGAVRVYRAAEDAERWLDQVDP
jgi:hypothetical protein